MINLIDLELEEMEEITEENQEEQKQRFKIEDLGQANWAFRKLAALNRKQKEIEQLAKAEIDRIKEWEKKEKEGLKNSENFFNCLLEEYYREEREVDPKFKLSTPYGQVTSRKQQPKWNYKDKEVIAWLKENNKELIRVKEEVNKTEFKKTYKVHGSNVITEDGEIIEGVEIEEREDSITIKVVE